MTAPRPDGGSQRHAAPRRVVLALGSNLGDRIANLQGGLDALAASPGLTFTAVSGLYETSPVGGPDQPDFLNAIAIAVSDLPALEILHRCLAAELALGRVRTETWGPRTLDIDVIACGDERSADPVLTLPHPRAGQRAFVLAPWHDVDPGARLPGDGRVTDLLGTAGVRQQLAGVRRVPGLELKLPAR